jgi:hypothetical protein
MRSLLIGGLLGASAATALRRKLPRRPRADDAPSGLAAFESAPCYREASESSRSDGP